MASTQAISYASKVDPKYERTILVITKIDKMETGYYQQIDHYNCLGKIAVRGKLPDESITIDECRKKEQQLFDLNQECANFPKGSRGILDLITLLMIQQKKNLIDSKPIIKK